MITVKMIASLQTRIRLAVRIAVFFSAAILVGIALTTPATRAAEMKSGNVDLSALVGKPADISSSAYQYRADRKADENEPESWIGLMQYLGAPPDRPLDTTTEKARKVLCSLLWEEVRPVRRLELSWPEDAKNRPLPEEIVLSYFDGTDRNAHTWWNPRIVQEAGKPEVSTDGRTYVYTIPVDTWGIVAAVRGPEAGLGLRRSHASCDRAGYVEADGYRNRVGV